MFDGSIGGEGSVLYHMVVNINLQKLSPMVAKFRYRMLKTDTVTMMSYGLAVLILLEPISRSCLCSNRIRCKSRGYRR